MTVEERACPRACKHPVGYSPKTTWLAGGVGERRGETNTLFFSVLILALGGCLI